MAEAVAFKPVKEFGAIALSNESELKFYVDEYRGYTYASVRTFLKRAGYSGPTKAGITMNPAILNGVLDILAKLSPQESPTEDRELARFPKKQGLEMVVRIALYKEAAGIDLREWVDDGTYKGWSKKGVRIPYEELPKAVEYLRGMRDFLAK